VRTSVISEHTTTTRCRYSSILSCFAFVAGGGERKKEACGFGCGVCWLDSYVIGCQVLEIWAAGGNDLRWGFYAVWTETALGRVFLPIDGRPTAADG